MSDFTVGDAGKYGGIGGGLAAVAGGYAWNTSTVAEASNAATKGVEKIYDTFKSSFEKKVTDAGLKLPETSNIDPKTGKLLRGDKGAKLDALKDLYKLENSAKYWRTAKYAGLALLTGLGLVAAYDYFFGDDKTKPADPNKKQAEPSKPVS